MTIEERIKRYLRLCVLLLLPLLILLAVGSAAGQSPGADVDALIDAMTLEEKINMLHGVGFFGTPARCLGSAGYSAGVEDLA